MYKLSDFYSLKCGCIKYTNIKTSAVKKGFELSGSWDVELCNKHSSYGLSGYGEGLQEVYRKLKEDETL